MPVKKTLHILLLLLSAASLWAVPARRVSITVEQPDGTRLSLTMRGDEHFHCLVTSDGVPVARHENAYYYALVEEGGVEITEQLAHEPALRSIEEQAFVASLPDMQKVYGERIGKVHARRGVAATAAASEVPTTGKVYVPVLLVQYADVKFSSSAPKTVFEGRVNGENYTDEGGCGSIREYFMDQSEGLFEPWFDVIGPITLDKNMAYYGGNDTDGADLRPRDMVADACRKAYSNKMVDFSRYDNNKDGYVDILYVIYAGYGEASHPDMLENTIWPHQWQLASPLALNGMRISRYACNNELDGYKGTELDGIGTFCHEFSHCLGLPDFYDTSSGGTVFGMNVWSVMDYGCYNNDGHTPCGYTAYEKDFLGWKPLVELRRPANVTLKPLAEGGTAYKIVNDANTDEFYVVEYRGQTGWDAYVPAEGMLVMHVDYLASAWYENVVNNDPQHQRMTIIPADGRLTAHTLVGDTYPGVSGNTELTASSRPAAKVYTGGYMGKDITHITVEEENVVTFNFMQDALAAPRLQTPEITSPSDFTLAWEPVDNVEAYDVQLELFGGESEEDTDGYVVHTARVKECRYVFEKLDEGRYCCRVRSVSGGICSRYSDPVWVTLVNMQLPSVGTAPYIYICNDSIYVNGPDSADVYYTIDGAYPTAYSMRYTGPFVTTDKITVKAIARREGYRNSSMAQRNNWFSCDGATYRVTSSTEPFRVVVSEAPGGNDENDYCGHYVFGEVIQHDTATYAVEGFDVGAFRYATKLRSVTVENSSMRHIGDSLFHGCFSLNAVVWNSPCALPQAAFDEDSYRNLLLYLPDTVEAPASFSRNPYAAIVVDGRSGPLTLDAQSAFYCPHPFTADRVTYRRTFKQTTGIGASAGWETLVLPFDVQHIAHASKGSITPFGGEGTKHCWLATPQGGSFAETSEIRANVPYIISMPNNNAYGDQSIAGSITFSAENALIHATPLPAEDEPQAIAAAAGEMVTVNLLLKPTYDPVGVSDDVYVLNVGYKYAGHAQGSVFVSGKYDLPPFSVYMVVAGIEQPAPFYRIHIVSGEEREDGDAEDDSHVHTFTVTSRGGYLYIVSPEERTVQLYDSVGRWIRSVSCMAGTTVVGPLDEGLYIMERTKVYVER